MSGRQAEGGGRRGEGGASSDAVGNARRCLFVGKGYIERGSFVAMRCFGRHI